MQRSRLAVAFAFLAFTSPASANWLAVYQKDEFDGKDRYFAVTSATEPWLGFVCEVETGRIKLFYKTKQRATRDMSLPIWPMKIALIIDDDPVRTVPGSLERSQKKIAAQSYDSSVIDLALVISKATRRVLVATDVYGDKYHQQEFSVSGAHRAISMLLKRCAKL